MSIEEESYNVPSYDVVRHYAQVVVARALCRCALVGVEGFDSFEHELAAEPEVVARYDDFMEHAESLISILLEVLDRKPPNCSITTPET